MRVCVCIYVCLQYASVCMHVYVCVWYLYSVFARNLTTCTCKADCVWVGRRRSRPKGNPRFKPFENCVFCVVQTWLNGIFPSPREFCGQLKRNQHTYVCLQTYKHTHTRTHTYIYTYRLHKHTQICISGVLNNLSVYHKHTTQIHSWTDAHIPTCTNTRGTTRLSFECLYMFVYSKKFLTLYPDTRAQTTHVYTYLREHVLQALLVRSLFESLDMVVYSKKFLNLCPHAAKLAALAIHKLVKVF